MAILWLLEEEVHEEKLAEDQEEDHPEDLDEELAEDQEEDQLENLDEDLQARALAAKLLDVQKPLQTSEKVNSKELLTK